MKTTWFVSGLALSAYLSYVFFGLEGLFAIIGTLGTLAIWFVGYKLIVKIWS